jgi:hypothetical protein
VVLLSHADTDLPTSRPLVTLLGSTDRKLCTSYLLLCLLQSPALADMATVVLATKPLPTGYSMDIHGTVSQHFMGDVEVARV